MDREKLLRRYALALSLVADPDVAGDLFMDARDEADLVRRATRWREGTVDLAAPLPPLTADQAEHALHLARRAALRRRSRLAIGLTGVALAVFAVGALLLRLPVALTRTKPVSAPPPAALDSHGLNLTAYKVETTPGTVVVTWGARSGGAAPPAWRPVLVVGGPQPQRVRALDTELLSAVPGRVLGRSTFRAVAQPGAAIWLAMETADDRDIVLPGLAVMERDSAAGPFQTVAVGRLLPVGPDRSVLIQTVTLTPDYIEVRYTLPDALAGAGWPHAEVELTLQAMGQTLRSYGMRDLSANGSPEPERAEYFPPLPDVSELRIVARVRPLDDESRFTYHFDVPGAISEWHRTATGLEITVAGLRTTQPVGGFLTDAGGRQWAVSLDCVTVVDGQLRRSMRVDGVPPDDSPAALTLVESGGAEPEPTGFIELPVRDVSSR